jgi:hypothetical protein
MIDDNVDSKLLETFIITAQDMHIQSILGENLYLSIMNMVDAGTISGDYNVLLMNYIMPAQMWWTIYEALPFISFKLTNKTVTQKGGAPNDVAASPENIHWLRNITKNNADYYTQRIREQIINNPSSYPEYFTVVGIERIPPRRSTYFSGMYLPRTTKKPKKRPGYSDPDCDGCDNSGTPLN